MCRGQSAAADAVAQRCFPKLQLGRLHTGKTIGEAQSFLTLSWSSRKGAESDSGVTVKSIWLAGTETRPLSGLSI